MARLPTPGSDSNVWGTVLNDFLLQAHNPNGTLKTGAVTSTVIAPDAISTAVIKDGSIPASKLQVTAGTNGQVLTYDAAAAGGLSWSNASGGGTATLGGDLTGSLSNAQIVANAITTTEIADAAVTNAKLASGIDQSKISGLTTSLSGKESSITAGTTSQYWRGDKSWQTLDKASVGLSNVDNTSDLNKPVSTATQSALDAKAASSVTITGTDSLAGGGDLSANRALSLVGDTATPGNSRYYGTNASGTRGFHAIPASDPTLGGDLSGTASNAQIAAGIITNTEISATAAIDQSKISGLATDLAAKVNTSALGAADGVATLDSSGKVPASQLPPAGTPGETNTASNVGTSGVGLYLQKTGTNLEFKKLRPGSNKVTLADDIATDTVSVDVDTANLGLTKSTVGLSNVDNTSDLNKPVSTATQSALDAKAASSVTITGTDSLAGGGDLSANRALSLVGDTATPGNSRYYGTNASGTRGFHAIPASDPTLGGDLSGTASNAQIAAGIITNTEISATAAIDQSKISGLTTSLSGKESSITAGTTSQYWRGDKSWQTLDKASVGLSNVDNTSDLNKPVSTATQSALDAKANSSSLATVATTGSYTDLINKPVIPNIVASATAPANPSIGDMWVDTSG